MNSINFDSFTITMTGAGYQVAVAQTVLSTKFGLIAGAAPNALDEMLLSGCSDIIGRLDMADAGDWTARPLQEDGWALALKPNALPRAVLWSAVVRAGFDTSRLDNYSPVDVVVDRKLGDEGIADAMRACALAGLNTTSLNGGEISTSHEAVLRWQQRKPWTHLMSAACGETLIDTNMRLPVIVRFGRRYVAYGNPAPAQVLNFILGGEMLAVETMDASEFLGQQEFELSWGANGRLSLNLLIDGAWRPLREIAIDEALDGQNRVASQEYRHLSDWSEIAAMVQVYVLDAIET